MKSRDEIQARDWLNLRGNWPVIGWFCCLRKGLDGSQSNSYVMRRK